MEMTCLECERIAPTPHDDFCCPNCEYNEMGILSETAPLHTKACDRRNSTFQQRAPCVKLPTSLDIRALLAA